MVVKVYRQAEIRLLEVWEYTEKNWNAEQADTYVREFVEVLHQLPSQRYRWRPVADEALTGVFFIRHRHHYAFFRVLPSGDIGVISILHASMDTPSRLREDAGEG